MIIILVIFKRVATRRVETSSDINTLSEKSLLHVVMLYCSWSFSVLEEGEAHK